MKKLFENDITRAAQLIRKLIGKIAVECRTVDRGKEYLDYSAVIDSLKVFSLFWPSGSNSLIWWRWCSEIRTSSEEAAQAAGCPATSLAVNSNPGEARFESTEKWRWGESNPRPKNRF